jgi:hypothetical protein
VTRRPRRGLPASLCGLLLLAACALVATDAIQILAHGRPMLSYPSFAARLHRLHWNGTVPAVVAGVMIVLGVILLLAALVPGRPVLVALSSAGQGPGGPGEGDPALPEAGITRRGLRNLLTAATTTVDGVVSVSLKLRRRSVATVARTLGGTEGITDAVRAALEQCLDQISPARRPDLRVRVTSRGQS